MKVLYGVLGVIFITGCTATIPLATPKADRDAKKFINHPAKSTIYIYRDEAYGRNMKVPIFFDSKLLGNTIGKTYYMVITNPGVHSIVAIAEIPESLTLHTKANKTYFIWQEIKMGQMQGRTKLHLVNPEKGKHGVLKSRLAK